MRCKLPTTVRARRTYYSVLMKHSNFEIMERDLYFERVGLPSNVRRLHMYSGAKKTKIIHN